MMKPATLLAVLAVVLTVGCRSGANTEQSATQENFGVRMAKMNLWREALFRFQRAVQLDPQDAMAHNNLAVAYEANGDFDNAAKEYREAMRLDKSNQYIQKNYSRLVEFLSRNKKRQQQQQQKTAGTPAANTPQTSGAPATTPPPSPAPTSAQPTVPPAPPPPQPQPPPPGGITA